MAASVTGSATVTYDLAPHLPASLLTTIFATAPENLTVAQIREINDALNRIVVGNPNTAKLGSLFV